MKIEKGDRIKLRYLQTTEVFVVEKVVNDPITCQCYYHLIGENGNTTILSSLNMAYAGVEKVE